ncbi:hypothetical protein BDD12DRAFT_913121 [Trichophaea hybrida]|nr:hypothetical protein BDD12DRAFT_913121 [Trichophaea hybrida]
MSWPETMLLAVDGEPSTRVMRCPGAGSPIADGKYREVGLAVSPHRAPPSTAITTRAASNPPCSSLYSNKTLPTPGYISCLLDPVHGLPLPVAVTVRGRDEVYLLAHRLIDYPLLLDFVQKTFHVSGDPECVWLERHGNNGKMFLVALNHWNDYAHIFPENTLIFQYPTAGRTGSGAVLITYIVSWQTLSTRARLVSFYRDPISWADVSANFCRAISLSKAVEMRLIVAAPYPAWWEERFGQNTVIDGEEIWEQVVNAAYLFAPDKVTDLLVDVSPKIQQ